MITNAPFKDQLGIAYNIINSLRSCNSLLSKGVELSDNHNNNPIYRSLSPNDNLDDYDESGEYYRQYEEAKFDLKTNELNYEFVETIINHILKLSLPKKDLSNFVHNLAQDISSMYQDFAKAESLGLGDSEIDKIAADYDATSPSSIEAKYEPDNKQIIIRFFPISHQTNEEKEKFYDDVEKNFFTFRKELISGWQKIRVGGKEAAKLKIDDDNLFLGLTILELAYRDLYQASIDDDPLREKRIVYPDEEVEETSITSCPEIGITLVEYLEKKQTLAFVDTSNKLSDFKMEERIYKGHTEVILSGKALAWAENFFGFKRSALSEQSLKTQR